MMVPFLNKIRVRFLKKLFLFCGLLRPRKKYRGMGVQGRVKGTKSSRV